jgi:hypothetical protein
MELRGARKRPRAPRSSNHAGVKLARSRHRTGQLDEAPHSVAELRGRSLAQQCRGHVSRVAVGPRAVRHFVTEPPSNSATVPPRWPGHSSWQLRGHEQLVQRPMLLSIMGVPRTHTCDRSKKRTQTRTLEKAAAMTEKLHASVAPKTWSKVALPDRQSWDHRQLQS